MKSIAFALLVLALPLAAQTAHEDLKAFADNSFLLEESYNQDPGVVQHIGVFVDDELTFTQEWPLAGLRHQISYDIPLTRDGFGDVSVNYRYQLVGDADADLAIAPRLSVILPTSQDGGDTGLSVGVPISRVLAPRLISHTNVDLTVQGDTELSLGQSLVYALNGRVHLLAEATYSDDELIVSPGVRWAYDRPSGLQIVPGVAVLFGDERSLLVYLSFEHPFGRKRQ